MGPSHLAFFFIPLVVCGACWGSSWKLLAAKLGVSPLEPLQETANKKVGIWAWDDSGWVSFFSRLWGWGQPYSNFLAFTVGVLR